MINESLLFDLISYFFIDCSGEVGGLGLPSANEIVHVEIEVRNTVD